MATLPFNLDLTVTKGITYGPAEFNLKDEDENPFDLTLGGAWKVISYARLTKDSARKIDLAPSITDAANGQFKIGFTDEQTLAQMAGNYRWDLILETPAGERIGPYFAGKYTVEEINSHA